MTDEANFDLDSRSYWRTVAFALAGIGVAILAVVVYLQLRTTSVDRKLSHLQTELNAKTTDIDTLKNSIHTLGGTVPPLLSDTTTTTATTTPRTVTPATTPATTPRATSAGTAPATAPPATTAPTAPPPTTSPPPPTTSPPTTSQCLTPATLPGGKCL